MPGMKPGMKCPMTDMHKGEKGGGQHRGRKFRPKRLRTSLPRPEPEASPAPAKEAERIAKVMARAGIASRREAEAWIAAGRVAVNGAVIASPALNVTAQDRISIDGKPLPRRERTRLFLFHKPRGLVTTSADTHGRPTIFGALPKGMPRLISVGRLDLNTEGLLLLTNDGGLARALELPATGWLRRYRVRAFGKVTQAQLDGLRNGITVDGVRYGPIEATFEREQGSNVWLTFAMREGKNREIRNVLRALGLQVNRLIRVSFGPFQLNDLPDGAVEEVKTRALREQIGDRLAAISGADFSGPIAEREEAEEPVVPRHPEARDRDSGRASKGDGHRTSRKSTSRSSTDPGFIRDRSKDAQVGQGRHAMGRPRRPPQDDGSKVPPPRDDRRHKGRRPYRGKRDR
jgi:23S rRNA pseudouridine2605 synthase